MRGRPIRPDQRAKFLEHLAKTANITASAEAAGFTRRSVYDLRAADPEFVEEMDDALEQATDLLESAARDRAIVGVEEYVVSGGRVVMHPETGLPLTQRRHSDTLALALLKAHRAPKFAPAAPSANQGVPAELAPDPTPTPDEPGPDKPVL